MRSVDGDQRQLRDEGSAAPTSGSSRAPGLGALAAAFFTGLTLALILTGLGSLVSRSVALAFLLGEVGFLAGAAFYLAATGRSVRAALRLVRVPGAAYSVALQLAVALLFFNLAATIILGPPAQDIEFVTTAEGTLDRVVLVIGVALAAPVIEEALFRGLLQGVLETRLRYQYAIAVAAMAFGLMHGSAGALLFFFWSLPVGWLTWRIGSILPAVVVHAVNNLIGLLGYLAAGPVDPKAIEYGSGAVPLAVTILLVAVYWAYRLCVRVDRLEGLRGNPTKQG
jgi:membrane protease YdiL (CAAX protease family)